MATTTTNFPVAWRDSSAAVKFLKELCPQGPWTVCALYDSGSARVGDDSGAFPTWTFTKPEPLRRWIEQRNGKANLYYLPNRAAGMPTKKPTKAEMVEGHVVHIDIDEVGGIHLASDPALKAATVAKLQEWRDPAPPSFIIDSGGGLQALWVLSDAVEPSGFATLESYNRHLAQVLGGDAGTFNVDRVLRLPGTINLPDSKKRARGRKPAPTRLLSATGVDFDPVWEFRTATAVSAPEGKDIDFGGPVPVEDLGALAAEYGLSKALLTIITEGRLPKRKDGDDSRSAWVFDATCRLIRSGVPNEKILGILTDERLAISESVFENSRGADEYAARTLRRAHAKIREHAAADFAGEPIDWQAEDGDEMINDARKQAAAAYYETLDKLDPETWGSVELFDHKDDAVQLLHLDEAAFEGLLMRWRERKVPRVTVFEKSVRSSLAKQLRAAAREAKAKARSAASAGVTDSAPKSGEWPHTLNYSSKFGADSVNAKLFLTARPGKLITSSGTLYSLEPACTWAEADEDGLRGEVRETDTEMTLGSSAISAIMRSVRDFTYTPAAPFEWLVSGVDTPDPKNLVLFRNGVLDLRTDELLELDGSYFATGTPAFDFDARAACPAWDDWLHERIDHSFIPTLQEWAGFVMVPDTTAHRFMTFIGKSRTGKGTAKNVLEALVGTAHVGSMAMSDFASNFGLMGALDKRLIVFPDAKDAPSAARGRALERLLAMTGGDRLHIDRKNKAPVDAKLMARLLILGNQHLHWVDESGALAARQIIITFDKTFKGKEDQRVGDSLMAELPGIANWALEGLRRLRANNYQFTIGEAGKAAIKAIRRASSPALRFAEDCLTVTRNPGDFVLLDNVYEAYENWVRQEGLSAGQRRSKTDFADDITATLVGVKITQPRNVPPPPSYTGLREKYRPRVLSGVSAVRYPFV